MISQNTIGKGSTFGDTITFIVPIIKREDAAWLQMVRWFHRFDESHG